MEEVYQIIFVDDVNKNDNHYTSKNQNGQEKYNLINQWDSEENVLYILF